MAPADMSNWREAPHNIWAFHNIDKVLRTRTISNDPSNASNLLSKAHTFNDDTKFEHGDRTVDFRSFLASTHTDGIVILHKGNIAYEKYFNDNTTADKHICMSMTKSITGLITGILASQAKLHVDDLVKKYLPNVSKVYDGVTIQHCLDMRSGVKSADDNHFYRAASGFNPLRGDEPAKNLNEFLQQLEAPTDGPGAGFIYSSVNTDLLGRVLEVASGEKYADLVSKLLWQRMGAESEALIVVDPQGNARAAGGLCATVRDMARLGKLIAGGGRGVVPQTWIEDMLHGGSPEVFAQGAWAPAFAGVFETLTYRDCWLADSKSQVFGALGIHGQMLLIDRVNDVVMAKMSSQPSSIDFGMVKMTIDAFGEVRRNLASSH